jgi:23S rRNA pseudouridine1911/1915/1917 synthase
MADNHTPNVKSEEQQSDDLYDEYRITVDKGQEINRIDKFLSARMSSNISRTRIQNAADAGSITVNGKAVKSNYKIHPEDEILLLIPRPDETWDLEPENIPIDIVYEDDDLLIVNKRAGMVCHPGHGNRRGTLINALLHHFKGLPKSSYDLRPGLVHRIDKDTSGIMVVAKTEYALAHLSKQFFDRTTRRKYIALAWGNIKEDAGTIDAYIGRHTTDRMQFAVFPEGEVGKAAVTHYEVIERLGYVTLVHCKLETGRTHQIRVHMKHIGHTLFNDSRYGGDRVLEGTIFTKYKQFVINCFETLPRQALHAATLGFKHPTTGEEMFFEQPIPDDMAQCIDKWRRYWQTLQQRAEIED